MVNAAGFVLHWSIRDLITGAESRDSGTYPIDQTRCIDLTAIPNVVDGHVAMCKVGCEVVSTGRLCQAQPKYESLQVAMVAFPL